MILNYQFVCLCYKFKIKVMKKFIVKEFKPVYAVWTYEVKANSEEEALEMVQNGEVENVDYETIDNYSDDYDYEIDGIKD